MTDNPAVPEDEAKPFHLPVSVHYGFGRVDVHSVKQAHTLLADIDWPLRGERHDEAVDACLKALDGHRSMIDARHAFVEAAREAKILAGF